jgi:hypothetical protein
MPSPVERFLAAIGYPEKAPVGASSFSVLVDGGEVLVRAESGRLFFSRALACGEDELPRLAAFVPGRMLREEAVLAAEPTEDGAVFLWQDAPDTAPPSALQRLFETFCDSCDWWLDRVGEFSAPEPEIPPMMIRP